MQDWEVVHNIAQPTRDAEVSVKMRAHTLCEDASLATQSVTVSR